MPPPKKTNCILVVDDEPQIRDVMAMMLSEEGYSILTAANGEEALEVLKDKTPNLIILDMNMPKMGGVVFYHNIASSYDGTPKYPVLVLTARAHLEDVFKDFQVDGFMSKPFKFEDLLEEIEAILKRRYSPEGKMLPMRAGTPTERKAKKSRRALVVESQWEKFNAVVNAFMNSGYDVLAGKSEKLTLQIASLDQPDAIFIKLTSVMGESPEIAIGQAIRALEKARDIPIFFYLPSALKIFPSVQEQISSRVPGAKILEGSEPSVLLQAFESTFQ